MFSHRRQPMQAAPFVVALVAVAVLVPASTRAQTADTAAAAVGSRVVIKLGAVLKVGDQVVDTGRAHHIYTIEKINDGWFWLVSGGVKGWAQRADVVTLDQAIAHCTSEIEKNPNAPWAYYNRGVIRHDQQEYSRAIDDYTQALRLDPNYVAALINRGNASLARNEADKAIADYDAAIRLEPKHTHTYMNRALAWRIKRNFDKAIADYDEAIRQGLKDSVVYNNRGYAWEQKNDLDKAIADYREALKLSPGYSVAHVNLGYALQGKGEYENALSEYAGAIRLDPASPWGYAAQAWVLATCPDAKHRDGKKAVELASKALELGGSNQSYLCEVRAAAHAEAGEFEQAVSWQTRAISAAANVPGANLEGDRARLKLYESRKPYRLETSEPASTETETPRG
jgi:tetratricopeptide (TPR) repeat protein